MTETLADRAERLAEGYRQSMTEAQMHLWGITAAATLHKLAASNATLATERNAALAAVTTAEQRAVNAEAALEAQRHTYHAAHIALEAEVAARIAEAVAQEREACAALVEDKAEHYYEWSAGELGDSAAAAIRARKDSTP